MTRQTAWLLVRDLFFCDVFLAGSRVPAMEPPK